jgi:HK97 family phage major capsid protein
MSEELKQINESIEAIGTSIAGERKAHEEMLKRIEKNESGQAEMAEQVKKWEEQTNALMDQKSELEQMRVAIQRMGDGLGEKLEVEGAKVDAKAFEQGLRASLKSGSINNIHNLDEAEKKAMSSVIDPDGGYLVESFLDSQAKGIIFDTSPVRSLANVVSIGTNAYECILDDDEMGAAWVGELSSRAATGTAQLGKVSIPVHILHSNIQITDALLEDSSINLMSWSGMKAADKFARSEATAFVSGTGVDRPKGFTTYTAKTSNADVYTRDQVGTKVTAGATTITTDELVELRALLKAPYRGNAYFAYNRATEATSRKLVDGQGNYIWQPVYAAGEPDQLLGQRTVIMEDMPDIATGAISVALADFRQSYTIVDRVGISLLDDPYSNVPYRTLRYRKRVGGGLTGFDSIKFLKQA